MNTPDSSAMVAAISRYRQGHGLEAFSPKAVLFDMDGVLYDSMPNHAVAWVESMRGFGLKMEPRDAYLTEGARGIDTIRDMAKAQWGRDISLDEAQRMYDEKTTVFHRLPTAPVMPGVTDLMRKVKRQGLAIAIVTGSGQRPLIDRLLHDFRDFVDERHLVTAYDVERGKPAPDPYLQGLRKAGDVKPTEAVVIENAPLGVRSGVAAGCFTIAVNTGPLPPDALAQEGASLVFPDMPSLRDAWEELARHFDGSQPKA